MAMGKQILRSADTMESKQNMKNTLAILFLLGAMTVGVLAAPLGTAFTYQGRLFNGANAASGVYDLRFTLYDAASSGAVVGPIRTNTATGVTNGLFLVTLDFGAGIFDGEARWLEVGVRTNGNGAFTPLASRQPLTPTPGALYATAAGSAVTASSAATAAAVIANAVGNAGLLNSAVTAPKIASGQVVKSLNTLRDDVALAAGANVMLATNGQTLTVSTPADWHRTGNAGTAPGTDFLGTIDDQPLELRVNSAVAFRLEPAGLNTVNVIGGSRFNTVSAGTGGATIGGGGTYRGALPPLQPLDARNTVQADYGTISGGSKNLIRTNGEHASIPGGYGNVAGGAYSFAAGQRAQSLHTGSFVWADSTEADFASSNTNQFLIRASGGIGINAPNPARALDVQDGSGTNKTGGNIQVGALSASADPKLIHFGDRQSAAGHGYVYVGENGEDDRLELRAAKIYLNAPLVGIGKTNPASPLDVNGTVRATSFLGDGSGLTFSSQTLFATNVGIGGAPSDARLDVEGNIRLNNNDLLLRDGTDHNHGLGWYGNIKPFAGQAIDGPVLYGWSGGGLGTFRSGEATNLALKWDHTGNVTVTGTTTTKVLTITGGADIAEPFDVGVGTDVQPGEVMCIDPERPGQLRRSSEAYDSTVAGIVSGAGGVNPGLTLTQESTMAQGRHPVALTGRVYCWVDADSGGAVQPGDLLTTSPVPGHAMKADRAKASGATLGKAMTRLNSGRGLVLVLVTLQ